MAVDAPGQECIVAGSRVPDVGNNGETDCVLFEVFCRRGPADPAAVLDAGVLGDPPFDSRWTGGKDLPDPSRELSDELLIKLGAPFRFPLPATGSDILIGETF